ncbi:helix-turn-helix domain-containing protein [Terriglobus sp.]|uniref:helix-turn-helix domain-containing protein n=1 Tax=Terriglobus sp. TaxID=1889013 RepID=UPI003AFFF8D2
MNEHLDLCLSLDQLAKLGQLSKPQFTRAFRQATGYSPHNFLITLRVKRACQLLKSTRKPVTTIAGQCGFSQHSHFSTAFRQATGMSPRMWRQEHGAVSLGAYTSGCDDVVCPRSDDLKS